MFEQVDVNSKKWFSLNNLKNEIWKPIKSFENQYDISNYGRIKSKERTISFLNGGNYYNKYIDEKILKCIFDKDGYVLNNLSYKKRQKTIRTHRLVAEHFIENNHNYLQINHIDENKRNNRVDNLEWCNCKHNINWGTGIERSKKGKIKKILQYDINGNYITTYNSLKEASEKTNIFSSNISKCAKGIYKQANGFIWKYYDNN